jgi:glycosyltransferase involved in cell wall biosynthesis
MSALFVSNVFPFPPRNGVTVPFCNYARQFQQHRGPVDLLVLQKTNDASLREANQKFFRNVYEVPIQSIGMPARVAGQLVGKAPYFAGWSVRDGVPKNLASEHYQVVMSTPRSVIKVVNQLRQSGDIRADFHVAVVHDIATLAKKNLAAAALANRSSHGELGEYIKNFVEGIRLRSCELNVLDHDCDLFIVQSDSETNWLKENAPQRVVEKSVQLSNGVDDEFFDLPKDRKEHTCTHIGTIFGQYVQRVDWLVESVWGQVRQQFPDSVFTISGRCSDPSLLKKFDRIGVHYRKFVDDPCDLYRDQSILLAPIYKGYGLINRVVQSMAAGTVVIGDKSAFNAIPGFEAGKHGFVADQAEDFKDLLLEAFSNPDRTNEVRNAASELIRKHFQWDARFETLICRLVELGLTA